MRRVTQLEKKTDVYAVLLAEILAEIRLLRADLRPRESEDGYGAEILEQILRVSGPGWFTSADVLLHVELVAGDKGESPLRAAMFAAGLSIDGRRFGWWLSRQASKSPAGYCVIRGRSTRDGQLWRIKKM